MVGSEEIQQALRKLKLRLTSGEIDEETYHRQRELVVADLSVEERSTLGLSTATPSPANSGSGTPRPFGPGSSTPVGPSGGMGRGLRTSIHSLADLDLQPGAELLGQWRLVRELGRGGFGAVFEAEEMHLHETQAVKVLDPAMVAKEELLSRFRREVSLMRKLIHPRIVRVFDYREDTEQLVALISMEMVAGGSVKQLVSVARERRIPVPLSLALEILGQTLEALMEAHSRGVIHRDVTPGNVLLAGGLPEQLLSDPGRDPQVKLVDFGIAGLVERTELSAKSRVLGTAAYVAPEVLDPSVEVTPAADVYGAGAVGYELVTGVLPVGRFREPADLRRDLPPEGNELFLSLLDLAPENRPSPSAAARAIRALGSKARSEVQRRERVREAERQLLDMLERQDEAAVRTAVQGLEAILFPGESSEPSARAKGWLARLEKHRREQEAARQREVEEERDRREVERRRLESQRRAEIEAGERRKREEEARERQRQEEERRAVDAERQRREQGRLAEEARQVQEAVRHSTVAHPSRAIARQESPGRKSSSAAWIGVVALIGLVVIGIGWGVGQKREADRQRAVAEQQRQAAIAEEQRKAELVREEEQRRRARINEEEKRKAAATAAQAERERIARERAQADAAEAARLDQERKATELARRRATETWRDDRTGLLWAVKDDGGTPPWNSAVKYGCDQVTFGGLDGWRLPSVAELESLYDPASAKRIKTRGTVELSRQAMWSRDQVSGDPQMAWIFDFVQGRRGEAYKANNMTFGSLCVLARAGR